MLSRIVGRAAQDSSVLPVFSSAAWPWTVGAVVAALVAGALLGVAVLLTGPVPVLMGVVGILVALLVFRYPEAIVVLMLALASQLIPSRFNIFVDLFVGRFQVSDLLLFWLLFVTALRVIMEKDFPYRRSRLDLPMALFYLAVLGGLATAVFLFGVNFRYATYEARTLAYYLAFFPITTLVRTRRQLVRLSIGVMGVAVLMAVSMLLQSTIQPGILADDWTLDVEGVVRIFHPGFSAVYVGLLMLAGYVATRSGRERASRGVHDWGWLQWAIMLVLATALFSTLARNLLIAGTVSFGLLALLLGSEQRRNLIQMLLRLTVSLAVVLVFLALVFDTSTLITQYAAAYVGRLERMFSSEILTREENLFSRWEEMQFAFQRLQENPILGTGLYNPYRPAFYEGEPITLRHFIHNAYLGIWLKTGIAGLVSFLWFSAAFLRQGFRGLERSERQGWKRVSHPLLRGVALGSLVAYVGLLMANFVAPSFLQPGSLAIMGVTLGLTTSILLLDGGPDQEISEGEVLNEVKGKVLNEVKGKVLNVVKGEST